MNGEQFARLKTLFAAACDLPLQARQAWLQAQVTDAALLDELLSLLAVHDEGLSRLTATTRPGWPGPLVPAGPPPLPAGEPTIGSRLGHWRLVDSIGHGGMGAVYLAERADGQFRQLGALKLLPTASTMAAAALLARERQILADLSHPNIARLIDGGTDPQGRPFLVMEFVEGMALDHHCVQRQLKLAERLQLFLQVCDAIFLAHQRLVIHCDIKPANILVDRRGRVVVLDFGIARLQEAVGSGAAGAWAFTPGFASPEQARGEPMTTATDVFALGRLLQALLPEAMPPGQRAELQSIVSRATASAQPARYATVHLLAEDVRRFLAARPVRAMPSSRRYHLRKLAARHPQALIVGMVLLLMFGAFAHRLHTERQAAVQARTQAEAQRDRALAAEAAALRERESARPSALR
jgi:serine/threonine-protein kinase